MLKLQLQIPSAVIHPKRYILKSEPRIRVPKARAPAPSPSLPSRNATPTGSPSRSLKSIDSEIQQLQAQVQRYAAELRFEECMSLGEQIKVGPCHGGGARNKVLHRGCCTRTLRVT